ncbi:ABC transporter permease [Corynebacterium aquatimens]|uniref:ABC transport system permease protein n=1 Tax=Corynebacterium aquatimens TaxID=1190508 RepID=A0A931DX10_9CORY|nr:ABC transporter permease [Corynebacterium aquatimens]MBG6123114.1 putative ABC transport system permease protein [Corynebacterium aquatimens]WJY66554.1 FtsX-like permease family protein [Corynebacterium aquatimens]
MFVGIREIFKAKGRFGLIVGTVALITLLVVVLTGLTSGLGKQNTSALEALEPQSVIFDDQAKPSFTTSRMSVSDANGADVTPLGTGQTLVQRTGGADESVAVLSLPRGTQLPGGHTLGDGAVASASLNLSPDEEIRLGGASTRVDAVTDDLYFAHTPVVWVPTETWQHAFHTEADGTVLLSKDPNAGMNLKDSFNGLPAYSSEQGSLQLIQGSLYAIAALVIIAFLTVWTMQRTRDLAILKAIGASNRYLLKDALGQSALLLAIGVILGGLAALAAGMAMAGVAPFTLSARVIAVPPAAVWALGMIGAVLATRSITKVNPQSALGGVA